MTLLFLLLPACGGGSPDPVMAPTPRTGPSFPHQDGERTTWPMNGFTVHLTAHRHDAVPLLTLLAGDLPCPLAFTVRRDRQTDVGPLLTFFQRIHDGGPPACPTVWDLHGMGPDGPGFLGQGRFYTLLFVPPLPFSGVEHSDEALVGIPFDRHETTWLPKLGPQRLLARLGMLHDRFPTTPWADPLRPLLVVPDQRETRWSSVPVTWTPSLEVATFDGGLRIALGPADLDALPLAEPTTLRLVGGRPADAVGLRTVTLDGSVKVHGNPNGPVGLNGLLLEIGPEAVGTIEDAAHVVLPPERWERFWTALRQREPITLAGTTIHFVEPSQVREHAGLIEQVARIERFELPFSRDEVQRRVDEEALRAAIGNLEVELINLLTDHPAPVRSMYVELLLQPDAPVRFHPDWGDAPPDPRWWSRVEAALGALEYPSVAAPLPVRLHLRFAPPPPPGKGP